MIDYFFSFAFAVLGLLTWFSPMSMLFVWLSLAVYSAYDYTSFLSLLLPILKLIPT